MATVPSISISDVNLLANAALFRSGGTVTGELTTSNVTVLGSLTCCSNVGVGKPVTSNALDVSGDVNFTGALYQNDTLFTGGQWTSVNGGVTFASNVGIGKSTFSSEYALDVSGATKLGGALATSLTCESLRIVAATQAPGFVSTSTGSIARQFDCGICSSAGASPVKVIFNVAFTSVPVVTVSICDVPVDLVDLLMFSCYTSSISTTGCFVHVNVFSGGVITNGSTASFSWIAMG